MGGQWIQWRYRVAERLGRLLVGERLDHLKEASVEAARRHEELERRVAQLAADLAEWRATAQAKVVFAAVTTGREGQDLFALRERVAALERDLRLVSGSSKYLAALSPRVRDALGRELAVTVALPVRNRPDRLAQSVESVLCQEHPAFELLIVDDGSTDRTLEVASSFTSDGRVRVIAQEWAGGPAARNRALGEARGEIIAYLDSDVLMAPGYLEALAAAYAGDPDLRWSYSARWIELEDGRLSGIQFEPFDRRRLEQSNYIDTNVIAHRRGLERELGGWDESLVITADWDLALRWSARVEPRPLPILACRYELGRPDQLTLSQPRGWDNFRVRSRHARRRDLGIRVLYAVAHYPQLTETYIEQEIRAARESGVHVEVWGFEPPEAPFETDVVVHTGSLEEVVRAARPDLIQIHWLDAFFQRGAELRATGLPLFVRGHGYELSEEKLGVLEADPAVSTVFLTPHFVEKWARTSKAVAAWVGFRPDLYFPAAETDRRMVFRAAAGLPSKNLDALFELAKRVPELRFVLAVGRAGGHGGWVDGLVERHRASGTPLELHVNLGHEQVAEISRRAGIYLHTHTLEQPFSSPISIVEAMASGSYLLVPRCDAAERYAAEAADYYGDLAEAERLLRSTLDWADAEWHRRRKLAIDRAFDHFVSSVAILPVLKCWLGGLGRPWPG